MTRYTLGKRKRLYRTMTASGSTVTTTPEEVARLNETPELVKAAKSQGKERKEA